MGGNEEESPREMTTRGLACVEWSGVVILKPENLSQVLELLSGEFKAGM